MNEEILDLLDQHRDGGLSPEQHSRLLELLKHDPEARRSFVHEQMLQAAFHLQAPGGMDALPIQRPAPQRNRWWSAWRPLTAAAAGIAFGMFCTSVVFGFVMPRSVTTASRLFALVDGSFEKASGPVDLGFPTEFGKWSGDEAQVVSGTATDGKQALRFVRAHGPRELQGLAATSCDVHQLVDLRPFRAEIAQNKATLELSAQFLDARTIQGERVRSLCKIYVFSGTPDALPAGWMNWQKEALAFGSSHVESFGGNPQSWSRLTARVLLPPQADFALIAIVAHKPEGNKTRTEQATFGEQFADDVRLTLETEPRLPVHTVQR